MDKGRHHDLVYIKDGLAKEKDRAKRAMLENSRRKIHNQMEDEEITELRKEMIYYQDRGNHEMADKIADELAKRER